MKVGGGGGVVGLPHMMQVAASAAMDAPQYWQTLVSDMVVSLFITNFASNCTTQ
jgi:hypothetical protein